MGMQVDKRHKQPLRSYLRSVAMCFRRFSVPVVHAAEAQSAVKELKPTIDDGRERLKIMFTKDDGNAISPELAYVYEGASFGVCCGCVIGGVLGARGSVDNFVSRNELTVFYNDLDAKRRLNDHVMVSTMRGALRWGWRVGFLSGMYILTITSLSVYRNKLDIFSYVLAGGVTGSIYRTTLGVRGMLAGGIVGTFLGSLYWLTALGLTSLTGTTMEDLRTLPRTRALEEQRRTLERLRKAREKDPVYSAHAQAIKPGELDALEKET